MSELNYWAIKGWVVCDFQLNCLARTIIYGQGRKETLSNKEMTPKRLSNLADK